MFQLFYEILKIVLKFSTNQVAMKWIVDVHFLQWFELQMVN